MTAVIVASFDDLAALQAAIRRLTEADFRLVDAFTPVPVELELDRDGDARAGRIIGWAAALLGLAMAGLIYAVEVFSAIKAYPFDSGGRPLNSWPVFLLAPFELGVLSAAVGGLGAFLWLTGLPRLNHPAFEIWGVERASRDRFLLAIAAPETDERRAVLAEILPRGREGLGDVWEGEL